MPLTFPADAHVIGMNGSNYSIARWLPGVDVDPELRWDRTKTDALVARLDRPTILIGFSRGAKWAIYAALKSDHVCAVVAHSPSFVRAPPAPRSFSLALIRTRGDLTPPFRWSRRLFHLLPNTELVTLDPLPLPDPQTYTEAAMQALGHQFHNCIPLLISWRLLK